MYKPARGDYRKSPIPRPRFTVSAHPIPSTHPGRARRNYFPPFPPSESSSSWSCHFRLPPDYSLFPSNLILTHSLPHHHEYHIHDHLPSVISSSFSSFFFLLSSLLLLLSLLSPLLLPLPHFRPSDRPPSLCRPPPIHLFHLFPTPPDQGFSRVSPWSPPSSTTFSPAQARPRASAAVCERDRPRTQHSPISNLSPFSRPRLHGIPSQPQPSNHQQQTTIFSSQRSFIVVPFFAPLRLL